jgi:L-lactate utilization protein LutC
VKGAKNVKAFLWTLVGLFFGMWFTERERRKEAAASQGKIDSTLQNALQMVAQVVAAGASKPQSQPLEARKDRTLEEMSEQYKSRRTKLSEYSDDDIAEHLDRICTQLAQPNMTPLEAERVGIALSELARNALNWDARKKTEKEHRAQKWIDEIGMEVDEDDE